jgi:hypothetical protein
MNLSTLPQSNLSRRSALGRWHLLLGIQSLVIVLLSINRLSSLALGYVAGNEFLRWMDLNPFPHRVAPADRLLLAINGLFSWPGR